jgi:hypothetical protein
MYLQKEDNKMNEILKAIRSTNVLSDMVKKQLKCDIDLHKSGVECSIYSIFTLNNCGNIVVELKNGIIVDLCNYDNDKIDFKLAADDKLLVKGSIKYLFDDPEFTWESKFEYSKNSSISELEGIRDKWKILAELLNPKYVLVLGGDLFE